MPTESFYSPRSNLSIVAGLVVCIVGLFATFYATGILELSFIWLLMVVLFLTPITRNVVQLLLFQIIVPIIVAMVFLEMYLLLHRQEDAAEFLRLLTVDDNKVGVFFQLVATLYAIVTGFTLWRAVADFTDLDMTLRREANQINSLSCFLDFFDNVDDSATLTAIKRMRIVLREYCEDVLGMTAVGGTKSNEARIRECIAHCEELRTPEENDRIALAGLIKGLAQLSEIRTERITIARLRLSPFLSFLLFLLAVITVSFFFLFDSSVWGVSHAIIPFLAFIHTFIIVMLMDIYYPYGGYWQANADPFREVQKRLIFDIETK